MIAILADIHGNLAALNAVLEDAYGRGCSRVISLGDVAGYLAQPGECIDILRKHGVVNIMGNHDSYLVSGEDCPRSKQVTETIAYQRKVTTPEQLVWLAESVPSIREQGNYYVHGGPKNILDQYLYRISDSVIPADVNKLFSGHTHVQTLCSFSHRSYCNPGSVGQPRDGDPRAAYAILSGNEVTLHRVTYDIELTVSAMKNAGFAPFFYENLYIGSQIGGRIDRVEVSYD